MSSEYTYNWEEAVLEAAARVPRDECSEGWKLLKASDVDAEISATHAEKVILILADRISPDLWGWARRAALW